MIAPPTPTDLRALLEDLAELPPEATAALDVDSLTLVRIAEALEARYGFVVRARDLGPENFGSLAAMADFVGRATRR